MLDIFCTNSAEMLDIFEFQQKIKKKETVEESNKVELKGIVCPTNGEILELSLTKN